MIEPPEQAEFLGAVAGKLGRSRRRTVSPPSWGRKPWENPGPEQDREAEERDRQAAGRSQLPAPGEASHAGRAQLSARDEASHHDGERLIRQFIEQAAALNTSVERIGRADFGRVLSGVIALHGIRSAVGWDDGNLHELQLEQALKQNGVAHRLWRTTDDERELQSFAASADLGITYADLGLADTGTVLLLNGGGRGRLVSLLPPVYVAVLPEGLIYPRLSDGMSYIRRRIPEGLPACINFITGPSRTGDIEADLSLGVHGPGTVHLILLRD